MPLTRLFMLIVINGAYYRSVNSG